LGRMKKMMMMYILTQDSATEDRVLPPVVSKFAAIHGVVAAACTGVPLIRMDRSDCME